MESSLRSLPSVDRLLADARVAALAGRYSHRAVARLVRHALDEARAGVRSGAAAPDSELIVSNVLRRAERTWASWPKRVINATGVVLHTNLGRAPLSRAAIAAAQEAAAGYTDLELDLDTGKRGSRNSHLSSLLAEVTGAEAGIVANNNASAVLLGLAALAAGREVIVSRGEAVEIGGGFRIPEVLRQSGAELVEVGATNRTYLRDYESAISGRTAAILKVHRSNFEVTGFTHEASLQELAELGRERGVPVLHDLGSGCLIDTARFGLAREPLVQDSISAGAALAFFSGDKLLGGPQAGLVAGSADHVATLARHPLARAVRCDKVTLAALSATLMAYLKQEPESELPIWRMISASVDDLEARATGWRAQAGAGEVKSARSAIGGGSLPGQTLPSRLLALAPEGGPDEICRRLRDANPPVIARIEAGQVLLDPRTVLDGEDDAVIAALRSALDA